MGPHCLQLRLLKHIDRREKQTTFVAIGALRINHTCMYNFVHRLIIGECGPPLFLLLVVFCCIVL